MPVKEAHVQKVKEACQRGLFENPPNAFQDGGRALFDLVHKRN